MLAAASVRGTLNALSHSSASHRGLLFWLNIGLKALFVGLLAFGAFSGLDQFEGKAFGWRLILCSWRRS